MDQAAPWSQEAVHATDVTLLDDVRHGEGRADRLYNAAEAILGRALEAKDLRTALQAIRAAAAVMSEGRQYLELRGDLTGEMDGRNAAPHNPIILMALPKCSGLSSTPIVK